VYYQWLLQALISFKFYVFLFVVANLLTRWIPTVSEVSMESSPGPSTSSASRPESDHRAQSSSANTPRAGTQMAGTQIAGTQNTKICFSRLNVSENIFIGMQCIPQRAALLKSMLNFLKKAIQDPAFSDGIRHGESLSSTHLLHIQNIVYLNQCLWTFSWRSVNFSMSAVNMYLAPSFFVFFSNGWVLAYLTQAHHQ